MHKNEPNLASEAMIEIIENQIAANNPPKVRKTLARLESLGIKHNAALKLIACALSVEIFEIMKNKEQFNAHRYDENLDHLPDMPWNDV
jgi:peroxiredoxin family protein